MDGKGSIFDYRSRMDKTLESPDLTNEEMLRTLVKNQILRASDFPFEEYVEKIVERKTEEVANFLRMLRSVSATDSAWKVKQDTEELRVMYQEGPEGSPFHTLLAEGYVDGPVDVCLCISYESSLYKKWWPQMAVPTFKIVTSQCLKRVSTFEQIALVRMKVPWPLSGREAVVHYLSFEYFQDGLVVVLLNSISDPGTVDISTHGFTRDGIPEAQDVVRIDVVGGFALQKVSANRSYFRTIANLDIKLDFVPPALINFISRQLIGSGFKLYKKEVAAVAKGDEEFSVVLKDPLYIRIREALYSEKTFMESPGQKNINGTVSIMLEEQRKEAPENNYINDAPSFRNYAIASNPEDIDWQRPNGTVEVEHTDGDGNYLANGSTEEITGENEIEELEETDTDLKQSANKSTYKSSPSLVSEVTEEITGNNAMNEIEEYRITEVKKKKKKVIIRPEIEQALSTLDKAISAFREYNKRIKHESETDQSDTNKGNSVYREEVAVKGSKSASPDQLIRGNETCAESPEIGTKSSIPEIVSTASPLYSSDNHVYSVTESSSLSMENNRSKITPASPVKEVSNSAHNQLAFLPLDKNQKTHSIAVNHPSAAVGNAVNGDGEIKRARKSFKFGCFRFISRRRQ